MQNGFKINKILNYYGFSNFPQKKKRKKRQKITNKTVMVHI